MSRVFATEFVMPRKSKPKSDNRMDGAEGASDATNGGGSGSGVPDADTAMRSESAATSGDVEADRKKLFPEAKTRRPKKTTDKETE
jgi:hypothetical protein